MYNLNRIDKIDKKFALLNSGEFLMNIDEVKKIIKASQKYIKLWKQSEIENYNNALLDIRSKESNDTKKYRERVKIRKKELEEKRLIYLILNKRNGLYKIGLSINPVIREKTLQSEEPEIEVINTYKGGFKIEREIHSTFKDKRVRGEWFKLNSDDLELLNTILIKIE
jgi:hypothetical protein